METTCKSCGKVHTYNSGTYQIVCSCYTRKKVMAFTVIIIREFVPVGYPKHAEVAEKVYKPVKYVVQDKRIKELN